MGVLYMLLHVVFSHWYTGIQIKNKIKPPDKLVNDSKYFFVIN